MNESVNDLKERNALICSNVHDEPTLLPTCLLVKVNLQKLESDF